MRKRLATWDEKFATAEEKVSLTESTTKFGYKGTSFKGDELSFPVEN